MKLEELNKLKKEIEADLLITDQNCKDKILLAPNFFQKYLSIFIRESQILKILKLDLEKIESEKFKFYLEDYNRSLNKGEIEYYISMDPIYLEKKREMQTQETICQFLEMTMQNFKSFGFLIRSYVDLRLFLGGSK
jgi:recombination/repair/ssDNA binding protein UvsY